MSRRAFTLMELLLVMLIVAAMLSATTPVLRGFFAGREADNAARTLVAYAQLARSQAIAQGQEHRLHLDQNAGAFWVTGGEEDPADRGRRVTLPPDLLMNIVQPEDLATRGHITFSPNGRTEVAVIDIIDRFDGVTRISCDSVAGRFRVVGSQIGEFAPPPVVEETVR